MYIFGRYNASGLWMSDNETAKELFFRGLDCLDQNDFAKAETFFVRTLELAKGHISALNNLAVAQYKQRKFGEAALTAREISQLDAGNLAAYSMLSNCQIEQGDFDAALATCETTIAIDPTVAEPYAKSGYILSATGRYQEAVVFCDRAIALQPQSAEAFLYRGNSLRNLNHTREALAAYDKALSLTPDLFQAWLGRGDLLTDLKHYEEAITAYGRALASNPDLPAAWLGRGDALAILTRYDHAIAAYQKALALNPGLAAAWLGSGYMHAALKCHDGALEAYDKALALIPDLAEAWVGRADALEELRRFDEALASYDKSLSLKPELANAWNGRANLLANLGRHDEAVATYDKALLLNPDWPTSWLGRGNVLSMLKRYDEALKAYDRALALEPGLAEAWLCRANAFFRLDRHDEAAANYDEALALKPGLAEAQRGRGDVFFALHRRDEAMAAYDAALSIKPDLAQAWVGRGNVLVLRDHHDEAMTAYDKALSLDPDLAEAWVGRGNVFLSFKRYDEAYFAYDKAFSLEPNLTGLEGARLHSKMHLCDWRGFSEECQNLILSIRNCKANANPFVLLGVSNASDVQMQCARLWASTNYPASNPSWQHDRYDHDRIRIAYLSADFRDHPLSYLMAGVFEQHDRKRFEITAISFGPDSPGEMRRRLVAAFDRFVGVKDESDEDVARLLRTLEVDIAVDLMGYTAGSRTAILTDRPAPIQVSYLGYPGTMGADFMDYVIADPTVIPFTHRKDYLEKIAYLPNSYYPNDDLKRLISERIFERSEFGLPERGFVFCCFNNAYKITPAIFDCWARILKSVEGSVLWLLEDTALATTNLRREAAARGVDANRLVFAGRMPLPEHLSRHRCADLFLDTLPYNAHTTASDALWTGLPVLTRIGEAFAGRVAASLLNAVGLTELIAHSQEDYERTAIDLATNPARLALIKDKLARNRMSTPLFNTPAFTRDIEAAYTAMHARLQAGLPPDHIQIPEP
jgi:predicted O-linked N-acetylglucosamine transferase (SPINDLY family)/predicted TPR repeat methyltransferase